MRLVWQGLAYLFLGLAIIGVALPGIPTTPFVIAAAWAAMRGSPRLHRWLLGHPHFGPLLRNWQRHGAVSRKAKRAAIASMVVCALILLLVAPGRVLTLVAIGIMGLVALWLLRRPEPPSV